MSQIALLERLTVPVIRFPHHTLALPLTHIHTLHSQAEHNTNISRQGVPILNPLLPSFQL
jgi:hypothetical protein